MRLSAYLADLIAAQHPKPREYAEPFAGGAGAALRLLVDEKVDHVHINDLDPGVAAFWRQMFTETAAFVDFVLAAEVTIEAWHSHHAVYKNPEGHSQAELAYATFFLNRCNRSGILTARPIGGLEQTGNWLIDARFNRAELAQRIAFIGDYRGRVSLTSIDARAFIRNFSDSEDVFLYVDPPYINQGDALYLNRLTFEDHRELANLLQGSKQRWMTSYDADDRIPDELFEGLRCAQFNIKHTAQKRHIGTEYAVFSDNLKIPHLGILPGEEADWIAI